MRINSAIVSRRAREPANISTMTHIYAGVDQRSREEGARERKRLVRRPFLFHRDPVVNLADPERSARFIKPVAASRIG